jgi:hypothetical protein
LIVGDGCSCTQQSTIGIKEGEHFPPRDTQDKGVQAAAELLVNFIQGSMLPQPQLAHENHHI